MLYNVQYVDECGELTRCSVMSHDLKMAIRETLFRYPDAVQIIQIVPATLDTVEERPEQTLGKK
tara:strand:- start:295 stop:486 length:192 start_codon:yes stop_codon:yes gene_type:complete